AHDIRLKKVRKREVIMRIDPCARSQIRAAYLGSFETCQYIRAQPVNDVGAIALVLADSAGTQIAVAIVLLAAVKVKCSSTCRPEGKLPPASGGLHRARLAVDHTNPLPETANHSSVFSVEEGAGEIHTRRRTNQPVNGKDT